MALWGLRDPTWSKSLKARRRTNGSCENSSDVDVPTTRDSRNPLKSNSGQTFSWQAALFIFSACPCNSVISLTETGSSLQAFQLLMPSFETFGQDWVVSGNSESQNRNHMQLVSCNKLVARSHSKFLARAGPCAGKAPARLRHRARPHIQPSPETNRLNKLLDVTKCRCLYNKRAPANQN
jgi:hypothetical protein